MVLGVMVTSDLIEAELIRANELVGWNSSDLQPS
jgi:hypothetical protein